MTALATCIGTPSDRVLKTPSSASRTLRGYERSRVLPDLLWHTQGWVLFGNDQIVPNLLQYGLLIVPCLIVALLPAGAVWERDEVGRLGLLVLGLLAGSVFGVFVDYFFLGMIYASHDTPPGSGWLQSVMYTVCGAGILTSLWRNRAAPHR